MNPIKYPTKYPARLEEKEFERQLQAVATLQVAHAECDVDLEITLRGASLKHL
jgi:hypothetical protein